MPAEFLSASPRLDQDGLFRRAILTLGLLLLLSPTANPQYKKVANEFDPGVNIHIDPGGRFKYDVYTERNKSEDLEGGTLNIGGGVSFRLRPLRTTIFDHLDTDKEHLLAFRLGYEYSVASESGNKKITNTVMADVTPRYQFPGRVLMSDRSRFELRWIDEDPSFRYRNRLRFERPFSIWKKTVSPFASAEAYWDSRYNHWIKFRYGGGVELQLIKIPRIGQSAVELTYDRERCTTCPDPHTNIFGAKFNVYVKRKK